ncbi:galactose-proton symport [Ophiocordyceps camponoti-floridani]|uniref:Galactose-proton symport n=1 Tax=Ophiocordyceps camponoti-floridani TaxID=2030778 RepID=A0A8H4QCT3_9HYPO|nr:galactose-proton symport [Ophiocordyceps camponoti-floridani]
MTPSVSEAEKPQQKLHTFAQHPTMSKHVPREERADLLPAWINPDLDRLMVVRTAGGSFRSWAESLVDLPAGSLFARISGVTSVWPPTYSTTQAGKNLHLELNSNIHFVNHSCVPTLEWDMERMEMRVNRDRDLKKGDMLSFFYPSTEWILVQPFDCWCGGGDKCFGRVEGAAKMDREKLKGYFLNKHIKELLAENPEAKE